MESENRLVTDKHILITFGVRTQGLDERLGHDFEYVKNNFCGSVGSEEWFTEQSTESKDLDLDLIIQSLNKPHTIIYMAGDILQLYPMIQNKMKGNTENTENKMIFVVKEVSYNYDPQTFRTVCM